MKAENIYINVNDSVSDVVEKIINSKSDAVILIIPENADITDSILNFQLIKREAMSAGKKIFISSDIEEVMLMARGAGIKLAQLSELSHPVIKDKILIGDIKPPQKRRGNFFNVNNKGEKDNEKIIANKTIEINNEKNKLNNQNNLEEIKIRKEESKKDQASPIFINEIVNKKVNKNKTKINNNNDKKFFTDYFEQDQFFSIEMPEKRLKKIKPEKIEKENGHSNKFIKITLWGIGIIFIFTFIFIYFLANAKVNIISNKYIWEKELPVIAKEGIEKVDTNNFKDASTGEIISVDENNLVIPLTYFEFSRNVSKTFETTEVENIEAKAKGIIRIYNAYNTSPQTLVATTRFMSSNGKIFRLVKQVIVPGAKIENGKVVPSYIDAEVIADKAGEEYNIGPTKFTIPGFQGTPRYETFYGESLKPMTGGYIGQTKIVGQSDVNKAKKEILDIAFVSLNEELKSKILPSSVLLDDAKRLILVEATTSPKIGEKADSFELDAKIVLKTLIFDENDVDQVFENLARKENIQLADKELFKSKFDYGVPRVSFDNKKLLAFPVLAQLTFRDKVDVNEFNNKLSGKNTKDLDEFFKQYKTIEKVDVSIWPSFLNFMPLNNNRIQIMVDKESLH